MRDFNEKSHKDKTEEELLRDIYPHAKENVLGILAESFYNYDVDLHEVAHRQMTPAQFKRFLSFLELSRRVINWPDSKPYIPIRSPEDAWKEIRHLGRSKQEQFIVLYLDGARSLMGVNAVHIGTLNRLIVQAREVFAPAIEMRSASIIVAHNHPSRNLTPSKEDKMVTKKLIEAGQLIGIDVVDHLIFTEGKFLSLRNETTIFD